jgi:16S rRNA (cytidine1402-2'-O)-methyltransferase
MAILYVVATPIGNRDDITVRALRILREVTLICAEDTRVTAKLLSMHDIHTPLMSYHTHSGEKSIARIAEHLAGGGNVAVVTDAGTPGISDPGGELVGYVRAHMPEVTIAAVPGPSAVAAALSVAGIPVTPYTFYGFIPHKKGRQTLFTTIAQSPHAAVVYESPHRLHKTLEALATHMPERGVVVVRELTKMFESVVQGTATEVLAYFTAHADEERGEIVIIVAPHEWQMTLRGVI